MNAVEIEEAISALAEQTFASQEVWGRAIPFSESEGVFDIGGVFISELT
jgi:hypothetical protein